MKTTDKAVSEASDDPSLVWAFVFIAVLSAVVFAGVWGITNALNTASP